MPGMKLDFLKNPSQRVATGKSLPLKQVEAIVLYGKPAQRAKVVQKLLPAVYGLSLNKTTHHVLLSLLDHCDNMDRVKMLYNVRRKLIDLSQSPVGNSVVQRMLETVPLRQKKEIAEAFVLNVDEDEFMRLCQHPFGNHVAQKFMEVPECVEVVKNHFLPHLAALSLHPYGMRVVANYIQAVPGGCSQVISALFPTYVDADPSGDEEGVAASEVLDKAILSLFRSAEESMVLSALLRHAETPVEVRDAICAHLSEFAVDYLSLQVKQVADEKAAAEKEPEYSLPDFGVASTHVKATTDASPAVKNVHVYCAALEHGDAVQRNELWAALAAHPEILFSLTHVKGAITVGVAAVRFVAASRKPLLQALYQPDPSAPQAESAPAEAVKSPAKKGGKKATKAAADAATKQSVVAVATDPVRSLLLRVFVEVAREVLSAKDVTQLTSQAVELSQNAVSSPVLQRLVEADKSGEAAAAMVAVLLKHPSLEELVLHPSTSFLLQAILQHASEEVRAPLVEALGAYYSEHLHTALSFAQGSRVMQKLLAVAPNATVVDTVNQLISAATKEEEAEEAQIAAAEAAAAAEEEDDAADSGEEKEEEEEAVEEVKELSRKEQREMNRAKHYDVLSHALVSYALHVHACYVVQALLQQVRLRKLDRERKLIMNELKPHVFDLAVSPWAGRVVLEAMFAAGSAQLSDAMKNVAFLRAESWLSDVSEDRKKRGNGVDPTLRNILKRQREDIENGVETKPAAAEGDSKAAPAHKKKKLFRSMKK